MKHKYFLPSLIAAVYVLTSCSLSVPITSEAPKNNQTYQVDFLFEYEGCKVYRFSDYGNFIYFTNCNGEVTTVKNDSTVFQTIGGSLPIIK